MTDCKRKVGVGVSRIIFKSKTCDVKSKVTKVWGVVHCLSTASFIHVYFTHCWSRFDILWSVKVCPTELMNYFLYSN